MPQLSPLVQQPPAALEQVLQRLGRHIHTARLRRRWRLEDGAERLGVSRFTVADVERGKPGTSIAADLGALWACSISWRRWPIPTGMGRARPWRRPANRARLHAVSFPYAARWITTQSMALSSASFGCTAIRQW
ncbi:MAG: helix-turn-helix domain-containing protein [Synechococcaceae cyanobacterium]